MPDRPYEVERDRFGVYYSGPLEVGECIRVVPVAEVERLRDALRDIAVIGVGITSAREDALEMQRLARKALNG